MVSALVQISLISLMLAVYDGRYYKALNVSPVATSTKSTVADIYIYKQMETSMTLISLSLLPEYLLYACLHRMLVWKVKAQLVPCWTRGQRRAPPKPGSPARWTCEHATGLSSSTTCVELSTRFTSPVNPIRAS